MPSKQPPDTGYFLRKHGCAIKSEIIYTLPPLQQLINNYLFMQPAGEDVLAEVFEQKHTIPAVHLSKVDPISAVRANVNLVLIPS